MVDSDSVMSEMRIEGGDGSAGSRVMTHVPAEHPAAPCDAFASDAILPGRITNTVGFDISPCSMSNYQIIGQEHVCLAAAAL